LVYRRHRQKSLARFWMFIIPLRDFESLLFMCVACACIRVWVHRGRQSCCRHILPACVTSLVGAEVGVVLTPQAVACTHVYTHNQERARKIKGETC
jgi:hypothetical protein